MRSVSAQKSERRMKTAATATSETGRGRGAGSSVIVVQAFGDPRVADRDQFRRRQAAQIGCDAESSHPHERGHGPDKPYREKGQGVAVLVLERRQDVVRDVDKDH